MTALRRYIQALRGPGLLRAGAGTLAMKLVSVGVLFIATVALTRLLGPAEYGVYIFVITLVGVFAEPQCVALRTVAVRHASRHLADGDDTALTALVRDLRLASLLGSGLAILVLAVVGWLMAPKFGATAVSVFALAALLPLLHAQSRINDGLLRAQGSTLLSQLPKLVLRPVLLIALVFGAAWLVHGPLDAAAAMMLQVAAVTGAAGFYGWLLRSRLGPQLKSATGIPRRQLRLNELTPLITATVLQVVESRAAVLLLGILGSVSQTGQFHAALRVAELIALTQGVASLLIEPLAARQAASGDTRHLQRRLTQIARWVAFISLPLTALIIGAREWLLLLFGEAFVEAAPVLAILALTQGLRACLGTVGSLLNVTGHSRETIVGTGMGLVLQLALGLWLIPLLGAVGAAWAALISMTASKLYLMGRVHRRLHLYTSALGRWEDPRQWRRRCPQP
jgi:O-antigen/teichoic acid export membrane protein